MNDAIAVGSRVQVLGARRFAGRVLALVPGVMVIAIAPDQSITLRQDLSSTTPAQWRYGKLPVSVREIGGRQDFAERLKELEQKTRTGDEIE